MAEGGEGGRSSWRNIHNYTGKGGRGLTEVIFVAPPLCIHTWVFLLPPSPYTVKSEPKGLKRSTPTLRARSQPF